MNSIPYYKIISCTMQALSAKSAYNLQIFCNAAHGKFLLAAFFLLYNILRKIYSEAGKIMVIAAKFLIMEKCFQNSTAKPTTPNSTAVLPQSQILKSNSPASCLTRLKQNRTYKHLPQLVHPVFVCITICIKYSCRLTDNKLGI